MNCLAGAALCHTGTGWRRRYPGADRRPRVVDALQLSSRGKGPPFPARTTFSTRMSSPWPLIEMESRRIADRAAHNIPHTTAPHCAYPPPLPHSSSPDPLYMYIHHPHSILGPRTAQHAAHTRASSPVYRLADPSVAYQSLTWSSDRCPGAWSADLPSIFVLWHECRYSPVLTDTNKRINSLSGNNVCFFSPCPGSFP